MRAVGGWESALLATLGRRDAHAATRTRAGFTLIELLVVIAVIGILAAMVFPVFARARESARKAVCLSNVRSIALAVQLYLADYDDVLPPTEHDPNALAYFDTAPGGGEWNSALMDHCSRARQANPYLRWAVIFDPYVRNRDVWRCPSARLSAGARWIIPDPDWLDYCRRTEGMWGQQTWEFGPCYLGYPRGWGGVITDSIAQGTLAVPGFGSPAREGAFVQSICTIWHPGLKLSCVRDPSHFVICADGGAQTDDSSYAMIAYPDLCHLECAACFPADWQACPWTRACGPTKAFLTDADLRQRFARHLGGSNLGFLDGHARWYPAEHIIERGPKWAKPDFGGGVVYGEFEGLWPWGPTTTPEGEDWSTQCGFPPLH